MNDETAFLLLLGIVATVGPLLWLGHAWVRENRAEWRKEAAGVVAMFLREPPPDLNDAGARAAMRWSQQPEEWRGHADVEARRLAGRWAKPLGFFVLPVAAGAILGLSHPAVLASPGLQFLALMGLLFAVLVAVACVTAFRDWLELRASRGFASEVLVCIDVVIQVFRQDGELRAVRSARIAHKVGAFTIVDGREVPVLDGLLESHLVAATLVREQDLGFLQLRVRNGPRSVREVRFPVLPVLEKKVAAYFAEAARDEDDEPHAT